MNTISSKYYLQFICFCMSLSVANIIEADVVDGWSKKFFKINNSSTLQLIYSIYSHQAIWLSSKYNRQNSIVLHFNKSKRSISVLLLLLLSYQYEYYLDHSFDSLFIHKIYFKNNGFESTWGMLFFHQDSFDRIAEE